MRRTTAVLLWVLTLAAGAAAQEFPSKPVRLVVPFPPGGPLDIAGRLIGKELQDRWGQPVVVENKPGSTIGPEYVTKSAPDGYTLMIISSTPLVTLPHLQKVPYDVLKDLVGVTQTTLLTYALVVNPARGIPGWHGIFSTGGTPKPVLDKLAAHIRAVLELPAVANRFRELGVEPSGVSGDAFNDIVRRDYARWDEIIRRNNLRAD